MPANPPGAPMKPPPTVIRKQWQRTQERWPTPSRQAAVRNSQFFMTSF